MTPQSAILNDEKYIPVYEHGFVGLTDVFGDDSTPPKTARISYGEGTKSVNDDRNLLRYLIRHKHTTPIEMVVLRFHLKLPIFVMRQHVRHRMAVMNEYSGRYSEMSDEFYVPYHEDIFLQSTTNKQGSQEDPDLVEFETKQKAQEIYDRCNKVTYEGYRELLDLGLARELARIPLGVGNYTECYWQINLHNFFHYSYLRRDSHAQKQIRDFADPMFELVERKLPIACEAFNDYIFEAETFSRMEMNIIRSFVTAAAAGNLHMNEWVPAGVDMSRREIDEFLAKFKNA
jgi:thymidylate synthase (FAD)